LTVLDLSCNQLTELDGLIDLVLLSDLNISDNMIVSLKPLNNLKNLVRLDASKNSIRKLEFQDTQLVQLADASFADNHISEIIGICSLIELCTVNLSKLIYYL
jgi:Leucine-rich repeat (LRR) protein